MLKVLSFGIQPHAMHRKPDRKLCEPGPLESAVQRMLLSKLGVRDEQSRKAGEDCQNLLASFLYAPRDPLKGRQEAYLLRWKNLTVVAN